MEPDNLQAASTYINNVLLARGLLKNGRPIDFAEPENEEGGTGATMGRIINLVNDLVLRRDREAEHRENLATTIRALRTEDSQKTLEIEKLKTKASELTRALALAEAQERSLKSNVAHTDATIRGLKEQVQRMKTTIQQVRAQCANDIRKRDLEMQRLKSHLSDRQRGKREGLGVTTININPAVDRPSKAKFSSGGEGLHDPGYSLRQETNDFLTELCQNLSDENDSLIMLARNTVQTLKDLQGLPEMDGDDDYSNGAASLGTHKSSHGPVTALPASCEELSAQMDRVLEHLRNLLTNPSFVPLEEVEVRDEEIKRLREGWEKMEGRWKQAVTLMDGWHKRLADGGGSIKAEELRMGMTLNLSVDSARDVPMDEGDDIMPSPIFEDRDAEEEEAADQVKIVDQHGVDGGKQQPGKAQAASDRALKERSENIRSKRSPRKVSFTSALQESPDESGREEDETLPVKAHCSDAVTRRPSKKSDTKPARPNQREARTRTGDASKPEQKPSTQTRMSVPQKLAAAESEARAAEQARKESESRKRSRAAKASSKRNHDRRRSTLTSDELGELMGMPTA
ncbi:Afadin and alpha-actinin-binding-domain-containing protein [Aspergillus floccosus]